MVAFFNSYLKAKDHLLYLEKSNGCLTGHESPCICQSFIWSSMYSMSVRWSLQEKVSLVNHCESQKSLFHHSNLMADFYAGRTVHIHLKQQDLCRFNRMLSETEMLSLHNIMNQKHEKHKNFKNISLNVRLQNNNQNFLLCLMGKCQNKILVLSCRNPESDILITQLFLHIIKINFKISFKSKFSLSTTKNVCMIMNHEVVKFMIQQWQKHVACLYQQP